MKVFKYDMNKREITFDMPEGARILSCQMQDNFPAIWALVNDNRKTERRKFVAVETGSTIFQDSDILQFIATVQDGDVVNHVFEVKMP